ncbi:MAG: glycosyltransferase family 4 protein [Ilumatobacteraceae bacterium]|nr:glycosyltransferase family 4 protein [Ilumatobacteraceae bacterium]
MRIGLVCPYSLSVPGGVQAQVFGMARELRRRGHETRVLGPCDGPPPFAYVTPLGNSLPTAANGSIAPLAPDPPAVLRTLRALNDESFDVVHIHEPLAPGPTLTSVVVHPAPTVGTFHAAGTSASYRALRPVLQRILNGLDRRVVVSKDALDLVRSHLGGEYTVLYNGVELERIRSTPAFVDSDSDAGGPPSVFFCGRHEHRKGLAVLIDAVLGTERNVRVWVAGHGPETDVLRDRTRHDDRFEWLGRVTDGEKFARLRSADVFCAPSLGGESFGVVLIEAMAAGTTVVASALDGYQNVATDGVDALLVAPGDAAALAAALDRVTGDRAVAAALRRAGDERAEQFSMRSLVDRYEEIYSGLLRP